jgi:hypothetical protein
MKENKIQQSILLSLCLPPLPLLSLEFDVFITINVPLDMGFWTKVSLGHFGKFKVT